MKIVFIIIVVVIGGSLQSCKKYMDMDHFFKDRMNVDTLFVRKDYADQWLADTYTHLRGENLDVASKNLAQLNLISDDMFFGDRGDELDYANWLNARLEE